MTGGRLLGLLTAIAALLALAVVSLAVGTKAIPLGTVLEALETYDPSVPNHLIVNELRVPRTIGAFLVGAALGLAGALMQGLTRNPLADPGLLGVSAGAALGVALGIFILGVTDPSSFVWFAFAGAAVASTLVYLLGSLGGGGASPVKLALAGAALSALLGSVTNALVVVDARTLDSFRFWAVGSVAGQDPAVLLDLAPFLLAGAGLAVACGPRLNALSLGDDVARSLGVRLGTTRVLTAVAVVLLVGAATATAGPVAFVGLVIPHLARALVGPDYRWITVYSMILGPLLLLAADILGRIVARPGEIQVGIVMAVLGAPVFIALLRRRTLAAV